MGLGKKGRVAFLRLREGNLHHNGWRLGASGMRICIIIFSTRNMRLIFGLIKLTCNFVIAIYPFSHV